MDSQIEGLTDVKELFNWINITHTHTHLVLTLSNLRILQEKFMVSNIDNKVDPSGAIQAWSKLSGQTSFPSIFSYIRCKIAGIVLVYCIVTRVAISILYQPLVK